MKNTFNNLYKEYVESDILPLIQYNFIPLLLQKEENVGHNSVSAIKTTVGLTFDKNEFTQYGISKGKYVIKSATFENFFNAIS